MVQVKNDRYTSRDSKFWNPVLETMNREELDRLHAKRIQKAVAGAYRDVAMYRELYDGSGYEPTGDLSLDEYKHAVPPVEKASLIEAQRRNPPYADTSVPAVDDLANVLYRSSGTTGTPLLEPGSFFDILTDQWTYQWWAYGLRQSDKFYIAFPYGTFMGFWAAHYDAMLLGAQVISGGGANTETRLQQIVEYEPTVLVATPSYAVHLAEAAREMGIDPRGTSIKAVSTAGEPGSVLASVRRSIEEAWDARAMDLYGISDAWGSCSWQCPEEPDRMHFCESSGYIHAVDAEGSPVASGEVGELVVTTYRASLQPIVKYRTGDIVEIHYDPCTCGRSWAWLRGGVLARADQMALVKGTNVYPAAVQGTLGALPELSSHMEITISRDEDAATDVVAVAVESGNAVSEAKLGELSSRAEEVLRRSIGVRIPVSVVSPGTLPRYEQKAQRIVDTR